MVTLEIKKCIHIDTVSKSNMMKIKSKSTDCDKLQSLMKGLNR